MNTTTHPLHRTSLFAYWPAALVIAIVAVFVFAVVTYTRSLSDSVWLSMGLVDGHQVAESLATCEPQALPQIDGTIVTAAATGACLLPAHPRDRWAFYQVPASGSYIIVNTSIVAASLLDAHKSVSPLPDALRPADLPPANGPRIVVAEDGTAYRI